MMVPKAEEPHWYEQGWLPHYAIGLSRREANRASMVYGFMRFKRDVLLFARPEYLAAKSPIGHKIVGFSTHLGTYGMGGPAFSACCWTRTNTWFTPHGTQDTARCWTAAQ